MISIKLIDLFTVWVEKCNSGLVCTPSHFSQMLFLKNSEQQYGYH